MQIFKKKKPGDEVDSSQRPGGRPSAKERIKALSSQKISPIQILKKLREEDYSADEVDAAMEETFSEGASKHAHKQKVKKSPVPAPTPAQTKVKVESQGISVEVKEVPKPKATVSKPPKPGAKPIPSGMPAPPKPPAQQTTKPSIKISISEKPEILRMPVPPLRKARPPKPKAKPKLSKPLADIKKEIKEVRKAVTKQETARATLKPQSKSPSVVNISIYGGKEAKITGEKIPAKKHLKATSKAKTKMLKPERKGKADYRQKVSRDAFQSKSSFKPEKREKVTRVTFKPVSAKLMVTKADVKRLESAVSGMRKDVKSMKSKLPKKQAKALLKKEKPSRMASKPQKKRHIVHHRPKPLSVGEEIASLKDSIKTLDRSVMRVAKDMLAIEEKIPSRKELEPDASSLAEGEKKTLKMLAAKPDYFDTQIAGVMKKIDELMNVVDMFTDKVNTLQQNFVQIKTGQAASSRESPDTVRRLEKAESENEKLSTRLAGIESHLESLYGRHKSSDKEGKGLAERIMLLEKALKSFENRQPIPDNLSQRVALLESSSSGIHDKLTQLSGDMQKLLDYFLQSTRRLDSRLRPIEARPPTIVKIEPAIQPAPQSMMQPSSQPAPKAALLLPPPPRPVRVREPIEPAESTIFTKLRESTVTKRPYPLPPEPLETEPDLPPIRMEDEDMDILVETIMDSMKKHETRAKITRDLMNAGYEEEQINRAFMATRMEPAN